MLLIYLLPTDQKIVANSEIVCRNEEMHNIDEYGRRFDIILENEKVQYGRREYNQSNGELHFHEEFVWEKGKGLVSYGSAYRVEANILYLNMIEQRKKWLSLDSSTCLSGQADDSNQIVRFILD